MISQGITFHNRTKTTGIDAENPSRRDAEFVVFAAICAAQGVSSYVREVVYTPNAGAFEIVADESLLDTDVGFAIAAAGCAALPSFILFGYCLGKGHEEGEAY